MPTKKQEIKANLMDQSLLSALNVNKEKERIWTLVLLQTEHTIRSQRSHKTIFTPVRAGPLRTKSMYCILGSPFTEFQHFP